MAKTSVEDFKKTPLIADLIKKGDMRRVGQLAISVGTVGINNELRAYGSDLLSENPKKKG